MKCEQAEHDAAVEAFFDWQCRSERLSVLKTRTDAKMLQLKHQLLEMLRDADVFVLDRGEIEDYYPETIVGDDKPSRAQDFCVKVTTPDEILACCDEQEFMREGKQMRAKEFLLIFESIFNERNG